MKNEAASQGTTSELTMLKFTIILYVIAFVIKLAGYYLTGIMVLLADALHSLSDLFIYSFLYIAMIWSRKESDEVHMFGYGRAQNVGALVAATLFIAVTSFGLFRESIPRLFTTPAEASPNYTIAFAVIGISMIIPAIPLVIMFGQKNRGALAKAQFFELFIDELSTVAALIGTLFLRWGYPLIDPIASLAVAVLIGFSGMRLFKENLSFLIGRSPGKAFLKQVADLARSVDGVLDVHDLRAEYIGPDTVHTGMHIVVKRGMPIEEADRIVEAVHERVQQGTGCRYCVIRVDPAEETEVI
ncbi:MAG: cation diffusion facilitator family transporter [Bacillota bacterium]|nr:cation diffusion facilitator family transporter [Bacillota bacterium]